jgi:catechol 2,3-dioxygenase-like lactoylglutathione lyase family enzyme
MAMDLKDCKLGTAAPVTDLARAREFYESKLGLQPSDRGGDSMIVYELGEGTALMLYVSEYAGTNRATLAGFDVPDFDAMFAELSSRGVEFERFEDESGATTDDRGVIDDGNYRVAFFKDPDGNIYSING